MNNELSVGIVAAELVLGPAFGPGAKSVAEFIRRGSWGHHASCTCNIGGEKDKDAVLDSHFRIRNTFSLRVLDASAFSIIPGFFVVQPIYMTSEKASDTIIKDAKLREF